MYFWRILHDQVLPYTLTLIELKSNRCSFCILFTKYVKWSEVKPFQPDNVMPVRLGQPAASLVRKQLMSVIFQLAKRSEYWISMRNNIINSVEITYKHSTRCRHCNDCRQTTLAWVPCDISPWSMWSNPLCATVLVAAIPVAIVNTLAPGDIAWAGSPPYRQHIEISMNI